MLMMVLVPIVLGGVAVAFWRVTQDALREAKVAGERFAKTFSEFKISGNAAEAATVRLCELQLQIDAQAQASATYAASFATSYGSAFTTPTERPVFSTLTSVKEQKRDFRELIFTQT